MQQKQASSVAIAGHLIFIGIMAWWVCIMVFQRQPYTFIDNFNLLIHEAGHWIFIPLGEFMHVLGGSLMQLIVPLLFTSYFLWWNRDWNGVIFGNFWFSENLINCSYYIADAQRQILPLLGNGTHDWHYLLMQINLLAKAEVIGSIVFWFGAIGMIASLLAAIVLLVLSVPDESN